MNHRIRLFIVIPILLLLGNVGYSKHITDNSHKYKNKNARELLTKGEAYCHKGRWEEGRDMLRYIEDYLPSSPELPLAKLTLADSFFFGPNKSYPEAILEYTNYLKIFPNSSKKDYVLYHIGLCRYASIGEIECDQTETKNAMEAFKNLLTEVPSSMYTADASAKILICRQRLAETELRVGIYYIKIFKYEPAEKRLRDLLDNYYDCVDHKRVYFFLAEALYKNGKKAGKASLKSASGLNSKSIDNYLLEAKSYYKKLTEEYPTSRFAAKANKRLIKIKCLLI